MTADVHNLNLVLLLNFCAKFGLTVFRFRHKRQAANRYRQLYDDSATFKLLSSDQTGNQHFSLDSFGVDFLF
jgi:hypothetical protein